MSGHERLIPFASDYVRLTDGSVIVVTLDPATDVLTLKRDSDSVQVTVFLRRHEVTALARIFEAASHTDGGGGGLRAHGARAATRAGGGRG